MNATDRIYKNAEEIIAQDVDFTKSYFPVIREVLACKTLDAEVQKKMISDLYERVKSQILFNPGRPGTEVTFGTSGWRGILGIDIFVKSVVQVIQAIIDMYLHMDSDTSLTEFLGVRSIQEAKEKGCVIGCDNRFCGDLLAAAAANVLRKHGFTIHFAGESTTGVLSAAVLQTGAAFSINFTPSHNPMEYGGLKYNAADGGPAAAPLTNFITQRARQIIAEDRIHTSFTEERLKNELEQVERIDSFGLWEKLVTENVHQHGIHKAELIESFKRHDSIFVVIDSVHGASRLHMERFFNGESSDRFVHLRSDKDVTFGGVAPEPSLKNLEHTVARLQKSDKKIKLGAIIDPDGDRIRFHDGVQEIGMNQFGAMAFHFLKTYKKKNGLVAKTVATSNLANSVALGVGEEIFETRVGFKEFKPVIGEALVCFEESDGISVLGHTPEKDAYIGLLLALDMVLTTGKNLHEYLDEIEQRFGCFYPDRDGIAVNIKGAALSGALDKLAEYGVESVLTVGGEEKKIAEVIDIDGRKMIFEDGSWVMIRPSGTEPKVRFYVESRTEEGTSDLVITAKKLLQEIGVI